MESREEMKGRILTAIRKACEKYLENDAEALWGRKRSAYENTHTFRIGVYLAREIEDDEGEYHVDMEYNRMIREGEEVGKEIIGEKVSGSRRGKRPDLIIHQRSTVDREGVNYCFIEVKRSLSERSFMIIQNRRGEGRLKGKSAKAQEVIRRIENAMREDRLGYTMGVILLVRKDKIILYSATQREGGIVWTGEVVQKKIERK